MQAHLRETAIDLRLILPVEAKPVSARSLLERAYRMTLNEIQAGSKARLFYQKRSCVKHIRWRFRTLLLKP